MRQVDNKINDALMEIKRALGINHQQQQDVPASLDPTVPLQEAQGGGPEFLTGAVTQTNPLSPVTRSLVAPVVSQVSYPHGNMGGREVTAVTYTQTQPAIAQGPWSNPPPPLFPAPDYMANDIQRRNQTDFPEPNLNHTRYFEQQPMNQTPINTPRVGQQQAYTQQQQAYNQQQQGYSPQQQVYSYHQLPRQQQQNFGPAPNYA
ncbi:drebrin-like protein [Lucilia sericata]|uniref:drebrin-like protein n=1 Tax=Lucilia sericata TaxID=13632 RepID=UPI0018A8530E|nr:drebrin-like protein [Lucilia sericata]